MSRTPTAGRNVIAAGLVSGVVVRDGNVGFALEVDPADGAAKEPLRKACEIAVDRLPGVLSVTAVLTAERPSGGRARAQGHAEGHAHTAIPTATHMAGRSGRRGRRSRAPSSCRG